MCATITTPRLVLRPFTEEDAESLYRYASDPGVGPAAGWLPHKSVEDSREIIRTVLSEPETYAVTLAGSDEAIGSVGLFPPMEYGKVVEGEMEIGYWIGVPFQGRGLIDEAVYALLERCFTVLGCKAVRCGYFEGNYRSANVMEKCGFRYHHTEVTNWLVGERTQHFTRQTLEEWQTNGALLRIRQRLYPYREVEFWKFQCGLIPTIPKKEIFGVRTPVLKKIAGEIAGTPDAEIFLSSLPHRYFEENQIHAFLIAGEKDFDRVIALLEAFLPYVNNWATCDQMRPAVFRKPTDFRKPTEFRKNRDRLLPVLERWLESDKPYTARFAVGMYRTHFLDGDFDPVFPERIAALRWEDYYVNRMIAWYFATALALHWEEILPYFRPGRLEERVRSMAIQKAIESRRLTPKQKAILRER